jgi:hypothetical protein
METKKKHFAQTEEIIMTEKKKTVYADKFFGKMKPGMMGDGFIGVNQEGRSGKTPKRIFPNLDDLTDR